MLRSPGVIDRHDKLEAMIGETALPGRRSADAGRRRADRRRALGRIPRSGRSGGLSPLGGVAARIEADPAVRFAPAIEHGETPTGSGAFLGHVPLADVIARFTTQQAA